MITRLKISDKKIWIFSAIFLVVGLALIAGLIYPIMSGIRRGGIDIATTKDQIAHADEQRQQLVNFEANSQNYKPYLESLDKSFVDPVNPIDFITFLENAALAAAVDIDIKLLPLQQTSGGASSQIMLQISLSGDFGGILEFINHVERGPYLAMVQKVTIQNQTKDASMPGGAKIVREGVAANLILQVTPKLPQ